VPDLDAPALPVPLTSLWRTQKSLTQVRQQHPAIDSLPAAGIARWHDQRHADRFARTEALACAPRRCGAWMRHLATRTSMDAVRALRLPLPGTSMHTAQAGRVAERIEHPGTPLAVFGHELRSVRAGSILRASSCACCQELEEVDSDPHRDDRYAEVPARPSRAAPQPTSTLFLLDAVTCRRSSSPDSLPRDFSSRPILCSRSRAHTRGL